MLAVAALSFALVLVVVRFWNSWRRLQALLEQLELHSIRDAFSHLPEDCSWSPIWQQNPRKRNYLLLARSLESLESHRETARNAPSSIWRASTNQRGSCSTAKPRARAKGCRLTRLCRMSCPRRGRLWHRSFRHASAAQVETFFALRFLSYIRYVMLHLRNLASFRHLRLRPAGPGVGFVSVSGAARDCVVPVATADRPEHSCCDGVPGNVPQRDSFPHDPARKRRQIRLELRDTNHFLHRSAAAVHDGVALPVYQPLRVFLAATGT